jgi:hypothetical protein
MTMSAEQTLTDRLLEAGLAPALIERWLVILRPRLNPAGKYRRSTGTPIATGEVAELVVAAVAREAVQNAPQAHERPEPDLRSFRARLIAERARQAVAPNTLQTVLQRLENPLGRIAPGS